MKASAIFRACADELERDQTLSLTTVRLLYTTLDVILEGKGYRHGIHTLEWFLDSLDEVRKKHADGDQATHPTHLRDGHISRDC